MAIIVFGATILFIYLLFVLDAKIDQLQKKQLLIKPPMPEHELEYTEPTADPFVTRVIRK